MEHTKEEYAWAFLRIGMSLIFLWAFFDKLFGLGFATCMNAETNQIEVMCDSAWINGGSPTSGFLKFGTHGPLSPFYQSIAGNVYVDWIFMAGLLLIGLSLFLGMGVKIAGYSGALMLLLMYAALLPPEHHPFLDEHIIYAIIMIGLTMVRSGHCLGLGEWWSDTYLVIKHEFLE